MNWDALFVITAWGLFLFIWLPRKYVKHRERMKSLSAINKGYRFAKKYRAVKSLSGGMNEQRRTRNSRTGNA